MFNSNGILALFPLALSVVVLGVLIFLTLKNEARESRQKQIISIVSYSVLTVGIVVSLLSGSLMLFALAVFLSLTVRIPHLLMQKQKAAEPEPVQITEPVLSQTDEAQKAEEELKKRKAEILAQGRNFVVQATEAFSDKDGLTALLDSINKSIMQTANADGGAIMLLDEFDDVITVKTFAGSFPPPYLLPADLPHKVARVETSFRFAQFPLGETIFGIAATTGKAELITDPLHDSRLVQNEPEEFLRLGSSYIIVPMIVKDSVIGVLALARKTESPTFTEREFEHVQILTDFASCAIHTVFSYQEKTEHTELKVESNIACTLQKSLQPKMTSTTPGATVGSVFNGADGVCGDYFDIIPCRKDRISFILADIAGKGMNSLVVMVMLRAILQLVVNTQKSAATILSWTNRGITGKINIDHFASMALVNYNPEAKTIQLAAAGSAPALLYHSDTKKIEDLFVPSDPIGVDRATIYEDAEFAVKSGDIMLLYTDGLVEAIDANSAQFGVERIKKLIQENAGLKAQDIAKKVKTSLKNFCGDAHQHDDQTMLVIKIH